MEHLPLVHSRIIQDEQRQSAASEGFYFSLTCLQSLGNTGNKQQAGIRPLKKVGNGD